MSEIQWQRHTWHGPATISAAFSLSGKRLLIFKVHHTLFQPLELEIKTDVPLLDLLAAPLSEHKPPAGTTSFFPGSFLRSARVNTRRTVQRRWGVKAFSVQTCLCWGLRCPDTPVNLAPNAGLLVAGLLPAGHPVSQDSRPAAPTWHPDNASDHRAGTREHTHHGSDGTSTCWG